MQKYKSKFRNRQKYQSSFEDILSMFGRALWQLASLPFRKKKSSEVAKRWKEVQELMEKDDSHASALAIMKADSILDSALQKRLATRPDDSSRGSTMGERLKAMEGRLDRETLQSAWDAHKVRNQIAHGEGDISKSQAQEAVAKFRSALNKLGEL